jgi:hypothetical protein
MNLHYMDSTKNDEDKINEMVEMGFEESQVKTALKVSDGSVENAINLYIINWISARILCFLKGAGSKESGGKEGGGEEGGGKERRRS